ncbi:MAG: sigma-70 family RNA polymerase sigma factor [Asticcacaulis sp.]
MYKTHRKALVDYAQGIVNDRDRAEDVVQDAWERIQVAEKRQTLIEPLRYFYRTVRNMALDQLRRGRREARHSGPDIDVLTESLSDEAPTPEATVAAREALGIVMESLSELPERTRLAFEMHRLGGYKLKDIAAHMDISVGLVHLLIAEAVTHCSERLEREGRGR